MKSLVQKHVRALELRKLGWSYSQIKKELGIAKSTASKWLNKYPLTYEQLDKLQFHNEKRIEHFRATMARKRQTIFDDAVDKQDILVGELTERELYFCGLALYWGEGGKTHYYELTFSNTDPRMIRFFLIWLKNAIKYPSHNIKIKLHLYQDMDIDDEVSYWSEITHVRKEYFEKPYIKATTMRGLTFKTWGHGTCNVIARGLKYARPVFAAMEVLARRYSAS
ncbi:MAG: hypothetical protein UX63_C0033G0011 [Microgenomates group bacterium GW2011_GWB1_46_7]|nr:MAG: hypothetical protein UX63_C0033G0011 [Microgenomates group bacterium GW2011_GWB1_46_7]